MTTTAFKQQLIDKILALTPNVKLVYLFGSQASEESNQFSDIDVAILTPHKIDPVCRWQYQQRLAELLNQDVDLVDLLSASTVMQNEVIAKGDCLFDAGNYAPQFETQVMSMYQRLNDERAELLTAFKGE